MVADFSVSCCEWECVCIHSAYHIWKVTCCQCGWEHLPPHYHHLTLQSHFVCLSWSPDSWMGPSLRDHSQRQTTSLWKAPVTYVRIWCHWLSHASGKQSKYVWVWLSISHCCHIRMYAHAQSTLKTSSCKASAKLYYNTLCNWCTKANLISSMILLLPCLSLSASWSQWAGEQNIVWSS